MTTVKQKASGPEETPLRVKGVGDGLWMTLDPLRPVDHLVTQAGKAFERLGHLTKNASVVVDSGEKDAPDVLMLEMERYLKERFQVATVTKAPPRLKKKQLPKKGEERVPKAGKTEQEKPGTSETGLDLSIAGRIRSGQRIFSGRHLTILGDVNPGAEVVAGGDILVLGNLNGTALAGQPDNSSAIIVALNFRPTQVQIGGYVAAGLPPLKESRVEFACVRDGNIVVKDYVKENPFGSIQFPSIRE
ncbi:MAG: septum site-determining protein MinC [Nitrospinota bacterium]